MSQENNTLQLGKIIDERQERDAIHVPIAPCVAASRLQPGQHVGLVSQGSIEVDAVGIRVGIIDPFLKTPVEPGQRCWLFLYPGSVTSLRHAWEHPAFAVPPSSDDTRRQESEKWLRQFADENRIDYAELVDGCLTGKGGCFGDH